MFTLICSRHLEKQLKRIEKPYSSDLGYKQVFGSIFSPGCYNQPLLGASLKPTFSPEYSFDKWGRVSLWRKKKGEKKRKKIKEMFKFTFLLSVWYFSTNFMTFLHLNSSKGPVQERGGITGLINSSFKLEENPGLKYWMQCLSSQIFWQIYSVCMYMRITKVLRFSLSTSLHDYSTLVSNLLSAGLTYSPHLVTLFMLLSEWCSLNTRHILCTINFLNLLG